MCYIRIYVIYIHACHGMYTARPPPQLGTRALCTALRTGYARIPGKMVYCVVYAAPNSFRFRRNFAPAQTCI